MFGETRKMYYRGNDTYEKEWSRVYGFLSDGIQIIDVVFIR